MARRPIGAPLFFTALLGDEGRLLLSILNHYPTFTKFLL
jgi:hypothetical protein